MRLINSLYDWKFFVWVRNHPFFIHIFLYLIVAISFILLLQNDRNITDRIVTIETRDACGVPDSKECQKRLGIIVQTLTKEQSLVIVCKALDLTNLECVKVQKENIIEIRARTEE